MFTASLTGSTHTITPIKYLKHLQHPDFLDPNAAPEDQLPAEDKWQIQETRSDLLLSFKMNSWHFHHYIHPFNYVDIFLFSTNTFFTFSFSPFRMWWHHCPPSLFWHPQWYDQTKTSLTHTPMHCFYTLANFRQSVLSAIGNSEVYYYTSSLCAIHNHLNISLRLYQILSAN